MDPPVAQQQQQRAPPVGEQGRPFRHRDSARIFAYIEIIFAIIEMVLLAIFGLIAIFAPGRIDTKGMGIPEESSTLVVTIFVGLHFLYALLKLWLGHQLLSASDPRTPLTEALGKTILFRNYLVVRLIAHLVMSWVNGDRVGLLFLILTAAHVYIIYCVQQFVRELEEHLDAQQAGGAPPWRRSLEN